MPQHNFPPLKNDRIIRAAKGQDVDKIPVWIMRQAGRYLPEFLELRKQHDFFEICRTPELACQVTLMPLERFDIDAVIIFSDILVIPQALGMEVEMKPGIGPHFPAPIREPSDMGRLKRENVANSLSYVYDAITLTRHKVSGKVPLIGFAGAPWTIMSYMIEGGGSKTLSNAKKWLYKYPQESHNLLSLITDVTIDYLVGQIKAGAQLIQVFESHCEYLSPNLFQKFSAPYLERISTEICKRLAEDDVEKVPLILFCKGGHFCLLEQLDLKYDVIGVDWTISPDLARSIIGESATLQGNLDPVALHAPADELKRLTLKMCTQFGKQRYIANLGHGIYPDAPVEGVKTFIEAVHSL